MTSVNPVTVPGSWRPYFGFQIVFHRFCGDYYAAPFLDEVASKLGNASYQCRFDGDGKLLCRARNGDSDAAVVGLSPSDLYTEISDSLLALRLQPEPPILQPFSGSDSRARYEHFVAQFASLQQWCLDRCNDKTILNAIKQWFNSA